MPAMKSRRLALGMQDRATSGYIRFVEVTLFSTFYVIFCSLHQSKWCYRSCVCDAQSYSPKVLLVPCERRGSNKFRMAKDVCTTFMVVSRFQEYSNSASCITLRGKSTRIVKLQAAGYFFRYVSGDWICLNLSRAGWLVQFLVVWGAALLQHRGGVRFF